MLTLFLRSVNLGDFFSICLCLFSKVFDIDEKLLYNEEEELGRKYQPNQLSLVYGVMGSFNFSISYNWHINSSQEQSYLKKQEF